MEKENFIIITFCQAKVGHEYKDGIVSQADQKEYLNPVKNFFISYEVFYNIYCYCIYLGISKLGYLNNLKNCEVCLEACDLSTKCGSVSWHFSWLGFRCGFYKGSEPASYNGVVLDLFIILVSKNSPYYQCRSYGLQGMTFNPTITAYKNGSQLRLSTAWNYR